MAVFNPVLIKVDNAGPFTGEGNNTYLIVGTDRSACLVDAGIGTEAHLDEIRRRLAERRAELQDVVITHGHADHAAGAPALQTAFPRATFWKYASPGRDDPAIDWRFLIDGDEIKAGDDRVVALHTPGHAPDHLAFWHPESRTAFTGDLINPAGSVLIAWSRGGDLSEYLESLDRLRTLEPSLLLPGHGGAVRNPAAVLQTTIAHRWRRHAQVLAAVERGRQTVPDIAESIYDDLDPALLSAARENVRAHLEKLKRDGLVVNAAGDPAGSDRWHPA